MSQAALHHQIVSHYPSGMREAASRVLAHSHSILQWRMVLPVGVAIFFFGTFTTVYIMMRRPSFGEGHAPSVRVTTVTVDAADPEHSRR
jgi:hypothetical protein